MTARASTVLAYVIGLFLFAQTSSAALIEGDLFTAGDALLTIDTSTGLDWLDLTATTNQSYNSIIAGDGGWTTTEGFRYASEQELVDLIFSLPNAGDIRARVELLLQLFGCTWYCGTGSDGLAGMYDLATIAGYQPVLTAWLNPDGVTAHLDLLTGPLYRLHNVLFQRV